MWLFVDTTVFDWLLSLRFDARPHFLSGLLSHFGGLGSGWFGFEDYLIPFGLKTSFNENKY